MLLPSESCVTCSYPQSHEWHVGTARSRAEQRCVSPSLCVPGLIVTAAGLPLLRERTERGPHREDGYDNDPPPFSSLRCLVDHMINRELGSTDGD